MLRAPPSRISLTSSDIADFEHRLAARQSAKATKGKSTKVRLSPGPARSTRLSFVPAEQNVGKRRAASSSSEATIHDEKISIQAGIDSILARAREERLSKDLATAAHSTEEPATEGLHAGFEERKTFLESSPRRQIDSFYGTEQAVHIGQPADESNVPSRIDGATDFETGRSPVQDRHAIPWTPRGSEVVGDSHQTSRQPYTEPRLLASARARRRQAMSHDFTMFRDSDDTQALSRPEYSGIRSNDHNGSVIAVPELRLPPDDNVQSHDLVLDPGAPVFVPRMRFGTATESSTESNGLQLHWSNVDTSFGSSNLRIRSSSEQNADVSTRVYFQQHRGEYYPSPAQEVRRLPPEVRPRRRSRTADQNIALPHITPAVDRYPLMRPALNWNQQGQHNGSAHQPTQQFGFEGQAGHQRQVSQQQSTTGLDQSGSYLQVRLTSIDGSDVAASESRSVRSVSPALSTSSRSTPNLLNHQQSTPQFSTRGSSLPWRRIDTRTPSFHRVPSMVSAASGMSGTPDASRQSSREALDAAAEFLRMRNSPLDDLTERFSRMSTSRPRSVGRSWERPPRPRVSLLTGDPFRPEPPPDPTSSPQPPSERTIFRTELPDNFEEPTTAAEDLVALALALPPSSPVRSSSGGLPSTPSLHFRDSESPKSPIKNQATTKSPPSSIPRKPVPASAATPKVPVYDDSKPSEAQPQTPADIHGSKRRAKTRSDITVRQPPSYIERAMMSSPPTIPERHSHRNTYPAATPGSSGVNSVGAGTTANQASHAFHRMRRGRAQRNDEQEENDLEGHLHGLEEDRRTWLSRRENGDLNVTPPREGRFERYLS